MVRCKVLTFGDFVTKSGRRTPFFINTGNYNTGYQLLKLGEYYAQSLIDSMPDGFDVLFGPAYKGIPLVVATAMSLSSKYGKNVAFCFNRKEAKDHGEGGSLVGHKLRDGERVRIVEDGPQGHRCGNLSRCLNLWHRLMLGWWFLWTGWRRAEQSGVP